MIPLWLTITCSIILLTVAVYNLITSDIDWKRTIKVFAELAIAVITGICIVVITIAIAQRLSC